MGKERRERLPVSVSAAVFIEDSQGRLLLLQQAAEWKGKRWGPPAGGMHAHESPVDTALREAEEERGDKTTGLAFVFRGKIASGEIKPREGEIADHRFFTPDEIEQLIAEGNLYKPEYNLVGIKDWLDGRSYPLDVVKPLSN